MKYWPHVSAGQCCSFGWLWGMPVHAVTSPSQAQNGSLCLWTFLQFGNFLEAFQLITSSSISLADGWIFIDSSKKIFFKKCIFHCHRFSFTSVFCQQVQAPVLHHSSSLPVGLNPRTHLKGYRKLNLAKQKRNTFLKNAPKSEHNEKSEWFPNDNHSCNKQFWQACVVQHYHTLIVTCLSSFLAFSSLTAGRRRLFNEQCILLLVPHSLLPSACSNHFHLAYYSAIWFSWCAHVL